MHVHTSPEMVRVNPPGESRTQNKSLGIQGLFGMRVLR